MEVFRCTEVRYTPPQLHLVLQSSTIPGQFDMWQNSDVPRSGVTTTPWLSNLVVQSTITPEPYYTEEALPNSSSPSVQSPIMPNQYNLLRNEDIPSTDGPPRGPPQLIKPKCTESYYTIEALPANPSGS